MITNRMTAISIYGLMKLGIDREKAWELVKNSDYCVGQTKEEVFLALDNLDTSKPFTIDSPSDLPEDLFKL